MIWTQWRRDRAAAHRDLERRAARAGIALRWWDGNTPSWTPWPVGEEVAAE